MKREHPKPLIYVAGPYSSNPVHGLRRAVMAAEELESWGAAVLVPHTSLAWDLVAPSPVARWYERDLHLLARCDAVYRLIGESAGADAEVDFAVICGLPVFDDGQWTEVGRFVDEYQGRVKS